MPLMIGTSDGLFTSEGEQRLEGQRVRALARGDEALWAISGDATLWRLPDGDDPQILATHDGILESLLWDGTSLWVGADRARLFRLHGGRLTEVDGFVEAPGRETWGTPWGGPPAVRSMAVSPAGTRYVNVHVGGVLRSTDGGATWEQTMEVSADAHQVVADSEDAEAAYAATARGLAVTSDAGASWRFDVSGLHAVYCRAVARSDGYVFVSASQGSQGRDAALYRRPLGGDGPLQRCLDGLPEWFSTNVDTACVAAVGTTVAVGDAAGIVYASDDDGASWTVLRDGLPSVRCLAMW